MKTNPFFLFFLFALLALGLSACTLRASTPAAEIPTSVGELTAEDTQSAMEVLESFATQTAMALTEGTVEVPTETLTLEESPTALPEATQIPESPATSLPPPTAGIPKTYSLEKGEHPFCIARRFDVDQNELLNINGLNLNSRPDVGFTLKIPQTGNPFIGNRALLPHPTDYTVRTGDTIYSIACMYGDVDPMAIANINNLKSPYNLTPLETIKIP